MTTSRGLLRSFTAQASREDALEAAQAWHGRVDAERKGDYTAALMTDGTHWWYIPYRPDDDIWAYIQGHVEAEQLTVDVVDLFGGVK